MNSFLISGDSKFQSGIMRLVKNFSRILQPVYCSRVNQFNKAKVFLS